MTQLQDYVNQVQQLIHDPNAVDFTIPQLIKNINQARTRVSLDLHCVRNFYDGLTLIANQERYPLSGGVAGLKLVSGGQNYVSPQVIITGGGGFGATATATVSSGVITGLTLTSWGQQYTSTPIVNIIDGSGWVSNWQIRQALSAVEAPVGAIYSVYNSIIALPQTDPIFIQWNSGAGTILGDGLYYQIATALGFGPVEMGELYESASQMPNSPTAIPPMATVGQVGSTYQAISTLTSGGQTTAVTLTVSNQQLKLQLASIGLMNAVQNGISSSPSDPANMIWNSGAPSGPQDAIAQVMANSLGMTPSQIVALYSAATLQANSTKTITNQQLRLALATNQTWLNQLLFAMSPSPSDPVNIQWSCGAGTTTGDNLYNLLNTATSGSATTIYALAATYPANSTGTGAAANAIVLRNIIDWNHVSVIWGTEKPMLGWAPTWPIFQAWCRLTTAVPQGRPNLWVSFPENNFAMIFRIPDQAYGIEIDAVCMPDPLVNLTDVETQINPPFDDCVQWYAAYLCFMYLQQWAPASFMFNDDPRNFGVYNKRVRAIVSSRALPRGPNIYANTAYRVSKWW